MYKRQNIKLPVWLSISCVIDHNTKNVTLGYDDVKNKTEIYEDLQESLKSFSKLHKGLF